MKWIKNRQDPSFLIMKLSLIAFIMCAICLMASLYYEDNNSHTECDGLPDCYYSKCMYEQTKSETHFRDYMVCATHANIEQLDMIRGELE